MLLLLRKSAFLIFLTIFSGVARLVASGVGAAPESIIIENEDWAPSHRGLRYRTFVDDGPERVFSVQGRGEVSCDLSDKFENSSIVYLRTSFLINGGINRKDSTILSFFGISLRLGLDPVENGMIFGDLMYEYDHEWFEVGTSIGMDVDTLTNQLTPEFVFRIDRAAKTWSVYAEGFLLRENIPLDEVDINTISIKLNRRSVADLYDLCLFREDPFVD